MWRCATCSKSILLTSVTETVVFQMKQKSPKDVLNSISTTALSVPADIGIKMKGCDDEVKSSEYIYSKKCKNKGFPNGVQMVFTLKIQKYIDKTQRNKKRQK